MSNNANGSGGGVGLRDKWHLPQPSSLRMPSPSDAQFTALHDVKSKDFIIVVRHHGTAT